MNNVQVIPHVISSYNTEPQQENSISAFLLSHWDRASIISHPVASKVLPSLSTLHTLLSGFWLLHWPDLVCGGPS